MKYFNKFKFIALLAVVLGLTSCTPEAYIEDPIVPNFRSGRESDKDEVPLSGRMAIGYIGEVPNAQLIEIDYEITLGRDGENGLDFDHVNFHGSNEMGHEVSFQVVVNLETEEVLYYSGVDIIGFDPDDIDTECGWCDCMDNLYQSSWGSIFGSDDGQLPSWEMELAGIVVDGLALASVGGYAIICGFSSALDIGPGGCCWGG